MRGFRTSLAKQDLLPDITNLPASRIGVEATRNLAIDSNPDREPVAKSNFRPRRKEERITRARRAVDCKARPRQRLQPDVDSVVGRYVVGPRGTAAQPQDCVLIDNQVLVDPEPKLRPCRQGGV